MLDYHSDAGLMHVGARYYDAAVGRFLTRDTYLDEHPYVYCDADPVNLVDPNGHKWTLNTYVNFVQAMLNKDWDTMILLIEATTGIEVPQGVQDAISAVPFPKKGRVNTNNVRDAKGHIDQIVRHIKIVIKEGPTSQDYKHRLHEIKTLTKNAYGDLK